MSRNCHNKKNFRQKFFEYTYRNRCLHRWTVVSETLKEVYDILNHGFDCLKALIRKVDLMLHLTAKNFQIEVKDTSLPVRSCYVLRYLVREMCHDEAGRGGYRKEIRRKDQVLRSRN